MSESQLCELSTVFCKERAGQDEDHLRVALGDGPKRRAEIIRGMFQLEPMNLQSQRLRYTLSRVELVLNMRVPEDGQAGSVRKGLREQLDFLRGQFQLSIV